MTEEATDLHALVARAGVHRALGIELVEISKDKVVLALPIEERVHQPYGILHGGVSALLAESAASMGGALNVPDDKAVVGIELNASHLRSASSGTLLATATPIRIGRTIQVWNIELTDESGREICSARCSLAVIDRP
jgi:1,4-dihydroxy-2-naphthoyl-CoA hydrolase